MAAGRPRSAPAPEGAEPGARRGFWAAARGAAGRGAVAFGRALIPIVLAMIVNGIILAIMGKDPLTFYGQMFSSGLFNGQGFEQTIIRMAPLLLMGAGLIVAFTAGIWNIGGDGQFLMAVAVVCGLGPPLMGAVPRALGLIILLVVSFVVGGVWTLVPAFLKARYALNEIITSLMMAFIGIDLADMLIKGPFRTHLSTVPQTNVIPFQKLLPAIPGTSVHVGILLALAVVVAVHWTLTRTAFGLRLRVLGASPRAAVHSGISVFKMTMIAFFLSGALIGLAGGTEILGVWGYVRADWNPGWGFMMFAIVFLARLNTLACIPIVGFLAVVQLGGHTAAQNVGVPDDFILLFVALILLFMAVTDLLRTGRLFGRRPREIVALTAGPGAPSPGGSDE